MQSLLLAYKRKWLYIYDKDWTIMYAKLNVSSAVDGVFFTLSLFLKKKKKILTGYGYRIHNSRLIIINWCSNVDASLRAHLLLFDGDKFGDILNR